MFIILAKTTTKSLAASSVLYYCLSFVMYTYTIKLPTSTGLIISHGSLARPTLIQIRVWSNNQCGFVSYTPRFSRRENQP